MNNEQKIYNLFSKCIDSENFNKFTVQEWFEILSHELSGNFIIKPYWLNPKYLFRGRFNYDSENNQSILFFNHVKELGAPPQNKKIKQGRCNVAGQSLLYCCLDGSTIFYELGLKEDFEYTILKYKAISKIESLGIIGAKELMKINENHNKIFGNHFVGYSRDTELFDDVISLLFKLPEYVASNYYNLTNAITKLMLYKSKSSLAKKNEINNKIIGSVYPSVQTEISNMNLVFEPNEIKKLLKPIKIYKYKILKVHNEHEFDRQLLYQSKKIYDNGEIKWEKSNSKVEYISDKEFI